MKNKNLVHIFLNGVMNSAPGEAEAGGLVIAVDGGARHALALGLEVHCLVGDLDSLAPEDAARLNGCRLEKYPREKDEIDFELALNLALELERRDIMVHAALGGRWDMSLANLLLPLAPKYRELDIRFIDGSLRVHPLCGPKKLMFHGGPGDKFSLISFSEESRLTLKGARYPLENEILHFGLSRGLSNEIQSGPVQMELHQGRALLFTGLE